MNKNSLLKIIEICGGQVALAAILATDEYPVKQAHVWGWLNKNPEGIPAIHVVKSCQSVDFKVTPHELRPDIYPHPDDGLPPEYRSNHDGDTGRRSNDRRHRHVVIGSPADGAPNVE